MIPSWLLMLIVAGLYALAAIDHAIKQQWAQSMVMVGFIIANIALAYIAYSN